MAYFVSVLIQCATAQTVAGTSALRVIATFLVSYNLHCFSNTVIPCLSNIHAFQSYSRAIKKFLLTSVSNKIAIILKLLTAPDAMAFTQAYTWYAT